MLVNSMNLSRESVTKNLDDIIKASAIFEEKLAQNGFTQSHAWIFHLREVLYDLRRLHILIADLFNSVDIAAEVPSSLKAFADTFLYEFLPHGQQHMTDLEENLVTLFPELGAPKD